MKTKRTLHSRLEHIICQIDSSEPLLRPFFPNSKITCLANYLDVITIATNTHSLHRKWLGLKFLHHQIYKHNIFCLNYTTYNIRCIHNTLNLRTHTDFITLSHEDDEESQDKFPYWFGQIVSIFHTAVVYTGPSSHSVKPQHIEFLFMWWFGHNLGH